MSEIQKKFLLSSLAVPGVSGRRQDAMLHALKTAHPLPPANLLIFS